jgi:hypothetical protein
MPINTIEGLQAWVVEQVLEQEQHRRAAHRFLLREREDGYGRECPTLSRTDRSRWKARTESVWLGPTLAARLAEVWPRSVATGGRTGQTPLRILELAAGTDAVAAANRTAAAIARERAVRQAREAALLYEAERRMGFQEAWEWLDKPHPALGNRSPRCAAYDADEGLSAARSLLPALGK